MFIFVRLGRIVFCNESERIVFMSRFENVHVSFRFTAVLSAVLMFFLVAFPLVYVSDVGGSFLCFSGGPVFVEVFRAFYNGLAISFWLIAMYLIPFLCALAIFVSSLIRLKTPCIFASLTGLIVMFLLIGLSLYTRFLVRSELFSNVLSTYAGITIHSIISLLLFGMITVLSPFTVTFKREYKALMIFSGLILIIVMLFPLYSSYGGTWNIERNYNLNRAVYSFFVSNYAMYTETRMVSIELVALIGAIALFIGVSCRMSSLCLIFSFGAFVGMIWCLCSLYIYADSIDNEPFKYIFGVNSHITIFFWITLILFTLSMFWSSSLAVKAFREKRGQRSVPDKKGFFSALFSRS